MKAGSSRPPDALARAWSALVPSVALAVGGWVLATPGAEWTAAYEAEADAALLRGDDATAKVCLERLLAHDGDNVGRIASYAAVLARLGLGDRSEELLAALAKSPRRAELDAWLDAHPEANSLRMTLGRIDLAENRLDPARHHLEAAARHAPELSLDLAKVYALRGEPEAARAAAGRARDWFRDRLRDSPDPDERARARRGLEEAGRMLGQTDP